MTGASGALRAGSRAGWLAAAVAVAVTAAGCAAPRAGVPRLDTGDLTHDGLARVIDPRVDAAYLKPDADLGRYTAVIIDPVAVSYKRPPRRASGRLDRRYVRDENFPLTEAQLARVRALFQQSMAEALTRNGGYRLVDAPGPAVLRVHAELIDLVVKVPTDLMAGRDVIYVDSIGEVTLIGELRDSQSGEILARAVDRAVHRSIPGQLQRSTPVINIAELKREFRQWSALLRQRLDALRSLSDTKEAS